jgi:sulfane dehydrogenase subunit SoxC
MSDDRTDSVSRRDFLRSVGAAGTAAMLAPGVVPAFAQERPKGLVKPVPADLFIDFGLNQETRLETLRGYLTPASHFYVRNHAPTPTVDLKAWRLKVEGNGVGKPLELAFDDLLRLPSRSVTCFVECAGNGRGFFKEVMGKPASGTQWRFGAIGVAEWTGVPLGEVLERAGLKPGLPRDILNVLIEGTDQGKVSRPITVDKALEDDTLLAYAMNGEPIAPDHGFPVRAIVPGWVGINNIKWAGRVEVRDSKIDVRTTTRSYILEGPDYPDKPPLRLQTLKSAVALPWGATLLAGSQLVRGFAWSPVGRIQKVEVSLDRGATWRAAALREPNIPRAWVRWELEWDARPGEHTLTTRATDDKGNTQPASILWNGQGYGYNVPVAHPVKVA